MLAYVRRGARRLRRILTEDLAATVIATLAKNKRVRKNLVRSLFAQYLDPSCRVSVAFADHAFLVDPKDTQIGFKLMTGRPWQRAELQTAIDVLKRHGRFKSGGAFLDVGANIGTQTVYALLGGEFARGVAIEAEPGNYALLVSNIELNGMKSKAVAVHRAASDRSGTLELRINRTNAGGHSVAGSVSRPARRVEVVADTVDAILREASVSAAEVGLVWIDVEGHELSVLQGMPGLLDARTPLVVEYMGGAHGQDAAERLRAILGDRYQSVVALPSEPTGETPPVLRLAGFVPEPGVSDLLIF